ncbi:hypothetical protein COT77_01485 [Candidatus Berkelbacteria bacterium CG10_big_fil_rev_8_21_14_0_10_41_12]|uniref:Antitoxin n=1 Tax=Candidatus Berkelbacteria bacterium CG10_big_fil_rev_8_21_14_0_10_41_12 TaxID=1974513 RepID=A0A2M6WX83_9BACT|nr:MAG: hypothetical protein COT77_01485 [Candidatus Berkelbacteria bacterium CG10_big_fil_rev_8_21_14_0_10_41_12]
MITKNNIIPISQIRKEAEKVLDKISRNDQPFYLFSRSQIKAVLVNPEKFAEMQEMVEDYLDQQELLKVTPDELKTAEEWTRAKSKLEDEN